MKILFFGDSNTYGYDPADFWEMRYPREKRWTYLLARMASEKWEIIPEGLNGRQIPNLKYDAARVRRLLDTLRQGDLFAVMLGTNDILLTMDPDADIAIEKMRRFLEFLTSQMDPSDILVIAPPHIGGEQVRDPLYLRYHQESKRMNAGFKELAQSLQVNFVDAGAWEVEMSADMVHLSENGHRQFADRLGEYLESMTGE